MAENQMCEKQTLVSELQSFAHFFQMWSSCLQSRHNGLSELSHELQTIEEYLVHASKNKTQGQGSLWPWEWVEGWGDLNFLLCVTFTSRWVRGRVKKAALRR